MTPLVLLPGMMCDARLFAPQVQVFNADRETTCIVSASHETISKMALDVLQKAPDVFALAGLSMGGIIAMEVLRQAPERVERLALMDTNPLAEPPDRQAMREPQIAAARAGNLARVMREEMKPNYLTDGPNKSDILDLCMAMALDLGEEVFVRQSKALAKRPDQTQTLMAARCPTLVLCGRDDELCPVPRHELMRDLIPSSRLVIVENAGHLPVLEQPDITNAALSDWLSWTV